MQSIINVVLPHFVVTLSDKDRIEPRVTYLDSSLHAMFLTIVMGAPYTSLLSGDYTTLKMPTNISDRVEIGINFLPPKGQLMHKKLWEEYLGYKLVLTQGKISLRVSGTKSAEWTLSKILTSNLDVFRHVPHRMIVQLDSPLSFERHGKSPIARVRNTYSMWPFTMLRPGSNITVLNLPMGTNMEAGESIAGLLSCGQEGDNTLSYVLP